MKDTQSRLTCNDLLGGGKLRNHFEDGIMYHTSLL